MKNLITQLFHWPLLAGTNNRGFKPRDHVQTEYKVTICLLFITGQVHFQSLLYSLEHEHYLLWFILFIVDGGYSHWTVFSECTKPCGIGTRFRTRTCDNPAPRFGGRNCSFLGDDKQTFRCNMNPCPGKLTILERSLTAKQSFGALPSLTHRFDTRSRTFVRRPRAFPKTYHC